MQQGTGGSGEVGEDSAEGFNPASLHGNPGWLLGAGQETKRRFLTGILLRCRSTEILENIQNVLQVTSGKDFTYARSRVKVECRDWGEGGLGARLIRTRMTALWEKFSRSPNWAKSKYLLEILSQCDTELLHMLGNLVRVLIARYKRGFLQCDKGEGSHSDAGCTGLYIVNKWKYVNTSSSEFKHFLPLLMISDYLLTNIWRETSKIFIQRTMLHFPQNITSN